MKRKILIILSTLFIFSGLPLFVFSDQIASQCEMLVQSNTGCPDINTSTCKELLEKCADYYDQQAIQLAQDITKTTQQKSTLQNQIDLLKKKIQQLEYEINQGNLMIKELNMQIADVQSSIDKTSLQIKASKENMAAILRAVYEEDKKPAITILLEGTLSDFFSNLIYLEKLNNKIADLLENTKNLKKYLEEQQEKMTNSVDKLQKTVAWQTLQKKENEYNKIQQDKYLQLTEAQYQQQLKEKKEVEQMSSKIKSMLFQMVGVSRVPTFEQAIEVATAVSKMVNIRPAFLLAIISQESAIGRNVGQCILTDPNTGNGKKVSTGAPAIRVMKPTRDIPIFLEITSSLGRDPYNTPVSCWIPAYVGGVPYGWGGAMGPAQFIPLTWNKIADRVKNLIGGRTPDPWGIKDSFIAAALYLTDLGATPQNINAESRAAAKYFGDLGSSSYSKSVMYRANCIQTFIDTGTMTSDCQEKIF